MNAGRTITLSNDLSQIEKLYEELELFGSEAGIDSKDLFNIHLALEELTTNVINYAYDDDESHTIEIKLSGTDGLISIELIDDGREFNPLKADSPDVDAELDERKIGGLGIFFVRKITDTIEYRRSNGKNILKLTKNINRE